MVPEEFLTAIKAFPSFPVAVKETIPLLNWTSLIISPTFGAVDELNDSQIVSAVDGAPTDSVPFPFTEALK